MKAEVIQGDCLEIMGGMNSNSVDAIIVDPPFFTPAAHYQSRISWGRCWGDLSILGQFFYDVASEYKRILKADGHLFVFCHDESYPVFYPVAYGLWDFTCGLIWDKTRVGLGKIFRHQFEMILWASNSGAFAESDGVLHSDILRYAPTLSADRDHPVQKPPELIEELLTVCTRPDALVLDTFCGSGTTGEACVRMSRRFIGVDIDPHYCEVARARIQRAQGIPCDVPRRTGREIDTPLFQETASPCAPLTNVTESVGY